MRPLFHVKLRYLGIFLVSVPLVTITFCFISTLLFRSNEVTFYHCGVKNYIPTISAITGIQPHRYFWRFFLSITLLPRYIMTYIYHNHYHHQFSLCYKSSTIPVKTTVLIWLNTLFQLIELTSFYSVVFIANLETVHDSCFITYAFFAMLFCYLNTYVTYRLKEMKKFDEPRLLHASDYGTIDSFSKSFDAKLKWLIYSSIFIGIVGIAYAIHLAWCIPYTFTLFSSFEYAFAVTNVFYHFTALHDFPNSYFTFHFNKSED
ncbi:hypothetical protein SNEBB_000903 [Seison nebaliae]|nr:hypothetical protein SNEBB_000903 [Seison nebaliae]